MSRVHLKPRWRLTNLFIVAGLAMLAGCHRFTPDAQLRQFFFEHKAEFAELATMAQEDETIRNVTRKYVLCESGSAVYIYPGEEWPKTLAGELTKTRWDQYQRLFRKLGLQGGIMKSDVGPKYGDIYFRVDDTSLLRGEASKGFFLAQSPPKNCIASLDVPYTQERPFAGCEALDPPWYLFIFLGG